MKITPANAQDAIKNNRVEYKPLVSSDFGQALQAATESPLSAQGSLLRPMNAIDMIPGVKGPVKPLAPLDPPVTPLNPLGATPFSLAKPRPEKTEHQKIEEQARKWLAQTFYGPMLKQMRESPFKSEMFSGGRGGQAFSSMLDQRLADHMSRSTSSKLVKSITRKLEAKAGHTSSGGVTKSVAPAENPYKNVRIHVATNLRA